MQTFLLTPDDEASVSAFRNFLSWGVKPGTGIRNFPPAVLAYVMGFTQYCPPRGEL